MAKSKTASKPQDRQAEPPPGGTGVEHEVPSAAPQVAEPPKGKLGVVVALLRRPEGARVEEISQATGWQAHSIRGAMSGALKKTRGYTISSAKTDLGRVYRITAEPRA
jgi:hypothetical protein